MEKCNLCGGKLKKYITYETNTKTTKYFYGDKNELDLDYENGVLSEEIKYEHILDCVDCGNEVSVFEKGEV